MLEKFLALTAEIEMNTDLSGLSVPGWELTEVFEVEEHVCGPHGSHVQRRHDPHQFAEE